MAWAFRAVDSNTGSGDVVGDKPTGTVNGDFLVALISFQDAYEEIDVPASGWTLQGDTGLAGNDPRSYVYTKIASSEPSTWTWETTYGVNYRVTILAYSGVDNTSPVNGISQSPAQGATQIWGSSSTFPNVAAGAANDLELRLFAIKFTSGSTINDPSGPTSRFNSTGDAQIGQYAGDENQGGTSTGTLGNTHNEGYHALYTLSIKAAAAGGVTATPGVASLVLTTFAPVIRLNKIATPGKATLTLTTFAPVVSTPRLVTPGKATLTLTTFAPVVSTPRLVTPGTASLTLTTFAPRVIFGTRAVPGTASLTLTTFAPSVVLGIRAVPATASLILTTFAPTVSTPRLVTPGTASLTLTTFAPTVSTPRLVTPGTASLTLTTFAPKVVLGTRVVPNTASLTLTTFAPTVSTPRLVTPGTASLVLTTFEPTIYLGKRATPATATLVLTTFAPTVSAPRLVTPGTASLILTTFAPTVTASITGTFVPGTASLILTTFAPVVSAPRLVTPGTAALILTTFIPSVRTPKLVTPGTAALILTTFAPTISFTANLLIVIGTAHLFLVTFPPTVTGTPPEPEPEVGGGGAGGGVFVRRGLVRRGLSRSVPYISWIQEFLERLRVLKKREEVILPEGQVRLSENTGVDTRWLLQNLEEELLLGLITQTEYAEGVEKVRALV